MKNGYFNPEAPGYKDIKEALLEGLQSRPHENKKLADMNIKQYKYYSEKNAEMVGKNKQDTFVEHAEVGEREGLKMARLFDETDWAAIETKPAKAPAVSIEPWKKDAMAFERTIAYQESRCAKLAQSAKTAMLKLNRMSLTVENPLAKAQCENLSTKLALLERAHVDFQKSLSDVDSNTEEKSLKMKEVIEPALKTLKSHNDCFEKVLKLALDYLKIS